VCDHLTLFHTRVSSCSLPAPEIKTGIHTLTATHRSCKKSRCGGTSVPTPWEDTVLIQCYEPRQMLCMGNCQTCRYCVYESCLRCWQYSCCPPQVNSSRLLGTLSHPELGSAATTSLKIFYEEFFFFSLERLDQSCCLTRYPRKEKKKDQKKKKCQTLRVQKVLNPLPKRQSCVPPPPRQN
jgi:hypothetical protein